MAAAADDDVCAQCMTLVRQLLVVSRSRSTGVSSTPRVVADRCLIACQLVPPDLTVTDRRRPYVLLYYTEDTRPGDRQSTPVRSTQ